MDQKVASIAGVVGEAEIWVSANEDVLSWCLERQFWEDDTYQQEMFTIRYMHPASESQCGLCTKMYWKELPTWSAGTPYMEYDDDGVPVWHNWQPADGRCRFCGLEIKWVGDQYESWGEYCSGNPDTGQHDMVK